MNETLKTIQKRFSCRDFKDEMPSDEALEAIALAALQAPSGMNRQPWQVIIVQNRELMRELEEVAEKGLAAMDEAFYDNVMSRRGCLFYGAPCMIVFAVTSSYPKGAEMMDLGIAAQNAVIAAASLGINSLHCGLASLSFAGDRREEFRKKLGIAENYEFGLAVLLGKAASITDPHPPKMRKMSFIR